MREGVVRTGGLVWWWAFEVGALADNFAVCDDEEVVALVDDDGADIEAFDVFPLVGVATARVDGIRSAIFTTNLICGCTDGDGCKFIGSHERAV